METMLDDRIQSFRMFLREPGVGRPMLSSGSALATEIVRQARIDQARTIVHLGGANSLTRDVIRQIASRDVMLINIEIRRAFAQRAPGSRSVHVVSDLVQRISEYLH